MQFPVWENTNLIHTAKKATDRNYLFMNNSQTTRRERQTRQLDCHSLRVLTHIFLRKPLTILRYFLRKSINTGSTIALQSLLTLCNSTNLETHIINTLHTHQNTRPLFQLKLSQMFHPSTDMIVNLPGNYFKYAEFLSQWFKMYESTWKIDTLFIPGGDSQAH